MTEDKDPPKRGGGQGRGGNSTKTKPYDQLTDGAKRGRRHKEKVKRERNEKGQFLPAGAAKKAEPTGPADPLPPEAKNLPPDMEALEILKKQEDIIKMRLENRRSERLSVERAEIEQDYVTFFDILKEGLEYLPAKFKKLRPNASVDDTNALLSLSADIIGSLRTHING